MTAAPSAARPDVALRPHVRLLAVVATGFVLTLVLVVVSLVLLGGVEDRQTRLNARLLPEQTRLQWAETEYDRSYAATLSLQASPNETTLGPQQYLRVSRARDFDASAHTAWTEYVRHAVGLSSEARLQARFVDARQQYSAAQIGAITALLAGTDNSPDVRAYQTGFAGMRDAIGRLQRVYAQAARRDADQARRGVTTTRRFITIEYGIGVAVFLGVVLAAFVAVRRRERWLAVQAVQHEREAQRAQLEGDLQRAFEMASSEEGTYRIISDALASSTALDVELLVADSSRAHFRQAATSTRAPLAGCPVGDPRECPATAQSRTLRFPHTDHLATCPYLRDRPDRPACAVCVPVTIAGKAIGVLHAMGVEADDIGDDDVDTLELVGRRSGDRLGTLRAFARTEAQARTDPLTGLLNRRSLEHQVQDLVDDGRPFVVAYGDVDHFKDLNDLHGHDTGDRALRLFARVLRDSVRPADIPARYGGEEFLVVLPDCGIDAAVAVVERFRERLAIELTNGQLPPFTVSFGVASATGDHLFSEAVEAADAALLRAKADGRNRVVVHRTPAPDAPTPLALASADETRPD
jgi:diguanylate cyclase (GGDEF)-like protein